MRLSRRTFALSTSVIPLLGAPTLHAQSGAPTAPEFEDANARLTDMLKYVPGGILDGEPNLIWNDHQRQVAAIRQHAGAAAEAQSDQEIGMMSLFANWPEILLYAAMLEELTGFSSDALVQTVQFNAPPNLCLVVQLNQPAEEIIPFLESVDYELRENEYGSFWTIGETGEMDLSHPVQSRLISKHNNVAMIADDVIAYAPTSELLGQIMATAAGDAPNRIGELEPLAAGLNAEAASAWFVDGDILDLEEFHADSGLPMQVTQRLEEMIAESDDAVGLMPVIRSVVIAATAGGSRNEELHNPAAQEFIILETDEAGEAENAAEVLAWRLENMVSLNTGEPYARLLPDLETEVLNGELLRATSPMTQPRTIFPQMIQGRDTLLFAYDSGE